MPPTSAHGIICGSQSLESQLSPPSPDHRLRDIPETQAPGTPRLTRQRGNNKTYCENSIMKKTLIPFLCTILASAAIAADERATTTTTTTTTYGDGTISEYVPGKTFIVKEKSGPVTYRYGKKVTYVTRKGRELSDEDVRTRIKVGVPVHVYYDSEGQERVVNRVEVDGD